MTKQEQVEKIQEIINDCYVVDSYIAAEGSEGGYIDTEEAAKAIVEAGYGDISGYETEREMLGSLIKVLKQRLNNKYVEIERLKDDYAKLQEQFADYQIASDKEIAAQAKQAKIDVLNKAKERLDSAPNGWAYTTYIDELIEEIENEQKD